MNANGAQVHYCGLVTAKLVTPRGLVMTLSAATGNRAACPRNSAAGEVLVDPGQLIAVDVLYQAADLFAIRQPTLLRLRHPVKQDTPPLEGDTLPEQIEIRLKSESLLPGTYLPEVSLAAGQAGFFGLNDLGYQLQLSTLWFIHPSIASWFVRADMTYWTQAKATSPELVLPDRMVTSTLGAAWRFFDNARLLAHAAISATSVFYRYHDGELQWGHRPAIRASLSLEWAVRRVNADRHKAYLFIEPQYTHFLNKSAGFADWTKQWGVMAGVRYAF